MKKNNKKSLLLSFNLFAEKALKKIEAYFGINAKEEKSKKCEHNPWDGYGLTMLRSRLSYIKGSNPKIYRIYNRYGGWEKEVGEHYQDEIDEARRKGLKVELRDNLKLIKELEENIMDLEQRIEEHKENCKDYILRKGEDGVVKYTKISE